MKTFIQFLFLILFPIIVTSQVYEDFIGAGNAIDVTVTSSDNQSDPFYSINGEGIDLDIQGSSRFLAHSTLGFTIEDVENLTTQGMEGWIDNQMNIEPEYLTLPTIEAFFQLFNACMAELGIFCLEAFQVNSSFFRYAWWDNTINGNDLLRQRVAFALSEVLVISDQSQLSNYPHGMAYYYDAITRNSFGNYRDLLRDVTLNPSMAFYLSHFNNPKTLPELNREPDENYAREIMQLFTIGLFELNIDGSRKIDTLTGTWIPTYDNNDIKGLAKVFTGLSGSKWEDDDIIIPIQFGRRFSLYSKIDPLAMYEEWHEEGEKHIVGNHTIPAGQTGMEDVEEALDVLFNHPNVGPFLALRLIQRMVKSNPSPDYIARIAGVFNDNGSGVRGDLAAMTKAILLDDEALSCFWTDDPNNGMLREPLLRLTQMLKGLKAETPNGKFWNTGYFYQILAGQAPLSSETVFNFFMPDYVPDAEFANSNIVGPEYQILTSSTSSNYVNYMLLTLLRDYINENILGTENERIPNYLNEPFRIPFINDIDEYAAELTDPLWQDLAFAPEDLLDYLDILLANGQLSNDTKSRIVKSMKRTDILDPMSAVMYATYLVMIDPEFVIMK